MNPTPAGNEPNRPHVDGPLAPTAPGQPIRLTRAQKTVAAVVGTGTAFIAALGFAGSYEAVTAKAHALGFGWFADWITIGIDAGIGIFLALDLLLTWLRMPYPLLRHIAWLLTAATIVFNASASWPNPLGVAMHAVIPVLFIAATEAARHAVGRIADITADKYLEGPPPSRWFLNPVNTFVLWRRQRLWGVRSWNDVLTAERERRVYKGKLRREYGRAWRRKAKADQLLVLRLATKDGLSITEAVELPAREEAKRRAEEARLAREAQQAEDDRRRQAELDRLEQERLALQLEKEREQADREREIAAAEARARLAEIERREQQAAAEAQERLRQQQIEQARLIAEQQERAAAAAKQRLDAEEKARLEAERKEAASRRALEVIQRAASASPAVASASASVTAANRPANASPNSASSATANYQPEPANAASHTAANAPATPRPAASASTSQPAASTATAGTSIDLEQVVAVYQLLEEQLGKAPSDQKLGEALGVSRSRAQQLRTAAIDAGHTALAKPVRLAS